MSRFVTLCFKLCESWRHIGEGELSRLASALHSRTIKFTIPSRVRRVHAQVNVRDSDSLITPESLLSGFERRGTGKHRLIG